MVSQLQELGRNTLDLISHVGRASHFLIRVIAVLPAAFIRPGLLIGQLYTSGVKMLVIVVITGFLVGMVLALQAGDFANENTVSMIVVLALLRELGPVVTAILFAALAGAAITTGIVSTKADGEREDARLMRESVAPGFVAAIIAMPLLAAIFSAVGVVGANIVAVEILGLDAGTFWIQAQGSVDLIDDLGNGVIKSLVFGFIVAWIAVFEGYDNEPVSCGQEQAAIRTVTYSAIAVLGLDFVLTALMFGE